MKRVVSLLFIIIILCSSFNYNVFAKNNSYLENGIFYYSFKDVYTFSSLSNILEKYNNAFKYEMTSDLEFKMGKKSDEFVFATFDENGVVVFIDDFYNSDIDKDDKEMYLSVLYDYIYIELDEDVLYRFINDLSKVDKKEEISILIFSFFIGNTPNISAFELFMFNNKWFYIVIICVPILSLMFLLKRIKNKIKINSKGVDSNE